MRTHTFVRSVLVAVMLAIPGCILGGSGSGTNSAMALDHAAAALTRPISGSMQSSIEAAKAAVNTARAATNAEGNNPDGSAGARAAAAYAVGLVANVAGIGQLDDEGAQEASTACSYIRRVSGTAALTSWCDKLPR